MFLLEEQSGFPITILIGGRGDGHCSPPLEWAPGVGDGEVTITNGGNSLYPLMSTYQQENLKGNQNAWIALEP